MSQERLFICRNCQQWSVASPKSKTCPYCRGELFHVPINMDQYSNWTEGQRQGFKQNYLAGKYEGTLPSFQPKASGGTGGAQQQKKSGCGGAILSMLIRVAIGAVLFFLVTGGINWVNQNNNMQRKADTYLNDIVSMGGRPEEGDYVRLSTRWVYGPFAEETQTYSYGSRSSSGGLTATVNTIQYYYVWLDDGSIMAIKTSNADEIETLDRMSNWFLSVDGFPTTGEVLALNGKLKEIKAGDLKGYYADGLSLFGRDVFSEDVHLLMLDTSAGREMFYILMAGAVVIVIVVLVVVSKSKKKRARA